ncbi:MAG: TonB-dependent receptor [Hymenobacteraceae bacterium]|nr:TonB-dependent receptor [Hymenobacteraceae bacterium]
MKSWPQLFGGWLVSGLLIGLLPGIAGAQAPTTATVQGTVVAADGGAAVEQVLVGLVGTTRSATTDAAGHFSLAVPTDQALLFEARRVGFAALRLPVAALSPGQVRTLTFRLQATQLGGVKIYGRTDATDVRDQISLTKIDPAISKLLPSPTGDFNRILATLPGVQANNELSSTYNVRGGNYDENLIYVNGIEIYRPFLVTSAQQEGLSFVNPDLAQKVDFSSGGWQPRYGDKLSSVLAVEYKRPTKFGASAAASMTGGTAHVESLSRNGRFTYLGGVRYRDTRYILRSLQTTGNYQPRFFDAQGYVTANLGPKGDSARTTLGLLVSGARNDFRVTPTSRETTFGTINKVVRLTIFYDGRERMQYDTWQGGLNLRHRFSERFSTELLANYVRSDEREFRDIEAAFRFSDVNTDPDSKDFNQSIRQRDVGSRFNHARNVLRARIATTEARATWLPAGAHRVLAGVKVGREQITDELDEYGFLDSADYVTDLTNLTTTLRLPSTRVQAYAQHTWEIDSARTLTYGVRVHHWSVNGQTVVSPRAQYSWRTPRPGLTFRIAAGVYQQPPFYRELRDLSGQLNTGLRAQRSYHLTGGTAYEFRQFGRPFLLTTEVYAKYLDNVVPYDVDNVRLRYFARNNATAYAAGADIRLSGEFIKGTESWFSLGVLTTRERIREPGVAYPNRYVRRPTDQRVQLGIMFQDQLPSNPTFRLQLFNVIGTGLPFSPPNEPAFRGTAKLSRLFWRTDIGFAKLIALEAGEGRIRLRSLWISFEVLNLLAKNNLVSYSYVQDTDAITYAVPNYLTQRIFNLRLAAAF